MTKFRYISTIQQVHMILLWDEKAKNARKIASIFFTSSFLATWSILLSEHKMSEVKKSCGETFFRTMVAI